MEKKKMTLRQHKARHQKLHAALDELVADFLGHTDALPSKTTILQLMEWANKERENPTPTPYEE